MATIREIAKKAGVSAGAVSRILNNDETLNVSKATRERVIKTAERLGYEKKNKVKVTGSSEFTLGIVQWFTLEEEMSDPYYLLIRQGIEAYCERNSISLLRFFPSDYGRGGSSQTDITKLQNSLIKADGLCCIGKFSEKEIRFFNDTCPNTIFLDMETNDSFTSCISMDFEKAVESSLDILMEKGHKKIAYLGGQEYVGDNEAIKDRREAAYEAYVKAHKLPCKDLLKKGAFTSSSGYEMMNSLLDEKKEFTAVFAASDAIAIGAMRAISEHGLSIPKDIAIIGFNDLDACRFSTPALSSVHAPAYEMGEIGANTVFNASRLKNVIPMKIKLPCENIIRESC